MINELLQKYHFLGTFSLNVGERKEREEQRRSACLPGHMCWWIGVLDSLWFILDPSKAASIVVSPWIPLSLSYRLCVQSLDKQLLRLPHIPCFSIHLYSFLWSHGRLWSNRVRWRLPPSFSR